MKVAIGHTKIGPNAEYVYKAWDEGLRVHGDKGIHIKDVAHINRIKDCDVVFQVSYPYLPHKKYCISDEFGGNRCKAVHKMGHVDHMRLGIYEEALKHKKRIIYLDAAVIKSVRKDASRSYYQVGYDCIKSNGKYYNENSSPDRWKKLRVPIMPWQNVDSGKYYIVTGQVRYGIGSQHIDIHRWYREVMWYLTKKRCKTYFRPHPNDTKPYSNPKFKYEVSKSQSSIQCVLSFSSNFVVDTISRGIPTIVFSELSPAAPHAFGHIEDINNLQKFCFEREQWLYDLAYTQWHTDEIKSGECWAHLKPHALKKNDVDWEKLGKKYP